jgi:hypothetical protein
VLRVREREGGRGRERGRGRELILYRYGRAIQSIYQCVKLTTAIIISTMGYYPAFRLVIQIRPFAFLI